MPPKKKVKLDHVDVTIEQLPEPTLTKVFSYLPVKERYRASAVCKRWLNVSRNIPWTDVSYLSASSIPNDRIKIILDLCPKLREFVACGRRIKLEENETLPLGTHLRSLRLYDVKFSIRGQPCVPGYRAKFERRVLAFLEKMSNLEELVWEFVLLRNLKLEIAAPGTMTASLRRLKIVNYISWHLAPVDIMSALPQMQNLECLHLEGLCRPGPETEMTPENAAQRFWDSLASLTRLRELCIAQVKLFYIYGDCVSLKQLADWACEKLRQLEVLIFASDTSIEPEGIAQLVASHPTLRILVIAGQDCNLSQPSAVPFVVPPRKLISGRPSPILQVFVGGPIVRKLRFTLPEANTTKFWLIDCEMPQFLAKSEVAEVFEGVWLAKMMREAVEVGQDDWVWGLASESHLFFTPAPRFSLRSSAALLDNYWPEAILRQSE